MKRTTVLLLATLAFAGTARAQEVQWGVQGGLNIPVGDLSTALDGRLGISVGGHAGLFYGDGHELRPRVDYTRYEGGYFPVGNSLGKNTIEAFGLGADYVFYTDLRPRGLYLTMGLGYQWWTVDPRGLPSTHTGSLSVAAGAGFRFNRTFGLEGRFTTGQFRSSDGAANALQLVGTLRF